MERIDEMVALIMALGWAVVDGLGAQVYVGTAKLDGRDRWLANRGPVRQVVGCNHAEPLSIISTTARRIALSGQPMSSAAFSTNTVRYPPLPSTSPRG